MNLLGRQQAQVNVSTKIMRQLNQAGSLESLIPICGHLPEQIISTDRGQIVLECGKLLSILTNVITWDDFCALEFHKH